MYLFPKMRPVMMVTCLMQKRMIEVVPDEVNDVQAESLKPVGLVSETGKV